jgi:hypothetical protein
MPAPTLPVGIPGEVAAVRWTDATKLVWNAALAAASYNVYRGDLADLDCGFFGTCRTPWDFDPADLVFSDTSLPATGEGFFYLVTGVDAGGNEGLLGASACGLRDNANACP